jgi:TorA maturation chaperone TorD
LPEPAQLAGRWVRWFDLGRVAPYEGSNVPTTVGGITPRLADIAGFYRAFGMVVTGDRPDHVVAQLEFLAVTLLAEAEATEDGDPERADIAARATRSFLRDHIGAWIDAWAARVEAIDELSPWFPYAAIAADLVRSEAANRNVIPLRESAALQADAGVASAEDAIITCDEDNSYEHSDR